MRRRRVGARAQARIRQGGPTSVHRPALSRAAYQALRAHVFARQGHRCFVCRRARRLDLHHVVKRSLGGADHPDNTVGLCRDCHAATDRPFAAERLVIVASGGERFDYRFVRKPSKWESEDAGTWR